MLKHLTPLFAITVWLAMVAVTVLVAAAMGAQLSIAIGTLVAVACIVPPSVVLMVWRGAPPPTVAEVLNAVDRRV